MPKPEYYHDLSRQIDSLREKVAALEREGDLFRNNVESLRISVHEGATETKVLDARSANLERKGDESRTGLDGLKNSVFELERK